jgi:hypothetical protein
MRKRFNSGIDILQRVEACEVNTWDVYTIFGEQYLGNDLTCLITAECRDGFAFEKVKEFHEMGADTHVYAYKHCSLQDFGIGGEDEETS